MTEKREVIGLHRGRAWALVTVSDEHKFWPELVHGARELRPEFAHGAGAQFRMLIDGVRLLIQVGPGGAGGTPQVPQAFQP